MTIMMMVVMMALLIIKNHGEGDEDEDDLNDVKDDFCLKQSGQHSDTCVQR